MRPIKTRWVESLAGEICFRPKCKPINELKGMVVTLNEFEAVRLCDLERLQHVEAADLMKKDHARHGLISVRSER